MFFDEEEETPSRPIPKVTIVSAPGKPRRPDGWKLKPLHGEGGSKPDEEDDEDDDEQTEKNEDKRDDKHGDKLGDDEGDPEPCKVGSDEEELVDPMEQLRECCAVSEECARLQEVLQECNGRVNSKEKTNETCVEELFDFLHCVNHCIQVERRLFAYLK